MTCSLITKVNAQWLRRWWDNSKKISTNKIFFKINEFHIFYYDDDDDAGQFSLINIFCEWFSLWYPPMMFKPTLWILNIFPNQYSFSAGFSKLNDIQYRLQFSHSRKLFAPFLFENKLLLSNTETAESRLKYFNFLK